MARCTAWRLKKAEKRGGEATIPATINLRYVGSVAKPPYCPRVLVADSPVYDWEAVLVISKAILAKAMPPGDTPGLYGFRRCRRRVRYSEIAHNRCGNTTLGSNLPATQLSRYKLTRLGI
jgi:hypothetical protein